MLCSSYVIGLAASVLLFSSGWELCGWWQIGTLSKRDVALWVVGSSIRRFVYTNRYQDVTGDTALRLYQVWNSNMRSISQRRFEFRILDVVSANLLAACPGWRIAISLVVSPKCHWPFGLGVVTHPSGRSILENLRARCDLVIEPNVLFKP